MMLNILFVGCEEYTSTNATYRIDEKENFTILSNDTSKDVNATIFEVKPIKEICVCESYDYYYICDGDCENESNL